MIHILYKRKPNIHQTQLTNFTGVKNIEVYKTWEDGVYNKVRREFPWVPVKPYNKRTPNSDEEKSNLKQLTLSDFIDWIPTLKGKYLYRFPKIWIPKFEDNAMGVISERTWSLGEIFLF